MGKSIRPWGAEIAMQSVMQNISRREFVLASLATGLAGCTEIPPSTLPPEGTETYSESIEAGLADPSGKNFLTVRLCQFPEAGVAWIWAAVYLDGRFWKFEDNAVRWMGEPSVRPGAEYAEYAASVGTTQVSYSRTGTSETPMNGSVIFSSSENGGIEIEIVFNPSAQFVGLIPGRTEAFGEAVAKVRMGGQDLTFAGPGKWHEQQQSEARFTVPFVYASLWGDKVYSTLLQTPLGSGGYFIHNDTVTVFSDAQFTPPADLRQAHLTGRDGDDTELQLEEVHHYFLTIYGKPWRGSFVKTNILGMPVCGYTNNWRI